MVDDFALQLLLCLMFLRMRAIGMQVFFRPFSVDEQFLGKRLNENAVFRSAWIDCRLNLNVFWLMGRFTEALPIITA